MPAGAGRHRLTRGRRFGLARLRVDPSPGAPVSRLGVASAPVRKLRRSREPAARSATLTAMRSELEAGRSRTPVVRRVTAGLILVAAAALAVWAVIGVVKAIFVFAVIVVAVAAVGWALKTLIW